MADTTLHDVRRRILESLQEIESARPARRWHGRPIDWAYRNHRVALGIVDVLEDIAHRLGETRVHMFADDDTHAGTTLVLQPTNPKAARLADYVNWRVARRSRARRAADAPRDPKSRQREEICWVRNEHGA